MSEHDPFEPRLAAGLRAYADRGVAPVNVMAFVDLVTSQPRSRLSWPWMGASGWARSWTGVAWLVVVAALVLGLVASLLLAGGSSRPTGWERLDLPGGGSIADVVEGPAGYVAVGRDGSLGGSPRAWTSTDCRTWQAAAVDDPGSPYTSMVAVDHGGSGLVAIGRSEGGAYPRWAPNQEPMRAWAWTSVDGRSWHLVSGDAFATGSGDPSVGVFAMAGANGRLVVVGTSGTNPEPVGTAMWTSTDGISWEGIDLLEARPQPFLDGLNGVAASSRGFVAVGQFGAGISIWASPDGLSWERVRGWSLAPNEPGLLSPGTEASFDSTGLLVGRDDGGFLALGSIGQIYLMAGSEDGSAWAPIAVDGLGVLGGPPTSMVAADGRYVVVGPSYPARGAIATSVDGRTWTGVPGSRVPQTTGLDTILRCGNSLIVSGTTTTAWPATWLLEGGATRNGLALMMGSAPSRGASTNGVARGAGDAAPALAGIGGTPPRSPAESSR